MTPPGEKYLRTPKWLKMPYGYKVQIKQISRKKMTEDHSPDTDGIWDVDSGTIWLVKSLSPERKRYVLAHEIGHAVTDWTHWLVNEGLAKG